MRRWVGGGTTYGRPPSSRSMLLSLSAPYQQLSSFCQAPWLVAPHPSRYSNQSVHLIVPTGKVFSFWRFLYPSSPVWAV